MFSNIFTGLFDTTATTVISVSDFIICIVVALIIGAFITWVYTYKSRYTASFAITLAMLPAVVCIVIMMVNGKGDRYNFPCYGSRTYRRNGLSGICSAFCINHGHGDARTQYIMLWYTQKSYM